MRALFISDRSFLLFAVSLLFPYLVCVGFDALLHKFKFKPTHIYIHLCCTFLFVQFEIAQVAIGRQIETENDKIYDYGSTVIREIIYY